MTNTEKYGKAIRASPEFCDLVDEMGRQMQAKLGLSTKVSSVTITKNIARKLKEKKVLRLQL